MSEDVEERMWEILKNRSNNEIGRAVRIGYYSVNQLPIHKHRATDIVKSWKNRGLVVSFQNGARASLTEEGSNLNEL